jgi:hypothetical protein
MTFGNLSFFEKKQYTTSKFNDYSFGVNQEKIILNRLNTHFNDNLTLSNNKYECFDAQGEKNKYEIKSRRINHNLYNDTIITRSKANNNIIFVFNFLDKLMFIQYDTEKFKKYKKSDTYQRKARKGEEKPPYQKVYFIPINELTEIN